jgi:hypothetical protein
MSPILALRVDIGMSLLVAMWPLQGQADMIALQTALRASRFKGRGVAMIASGLHPQ